MDMLVQVITRIFIFFGECVGNCIYALWTGVLRRKQSGGFTRSSKPTKTQKSEEEENRRIAGCREVVTYMATAHGYIARECMSREELEQKIDKGIKPRQNILYTSAEINRLYSAPEYLYAVWTSSKSHNCSAGNGNRACRPRGLGR